METVKATLIHLLGNWKIYLPTVLAIGGVIQSIYHCFDPRFCDAVIAIAAALGIYSTGHGGSDKTTPQS